MDRFLKRTAERKTDAGGESKRQKTDSEDWGKLEPRKIVVR